MVNIKNAKSTRYSLILTACVILMVLLTIRLFALSVIQHKTWSKSAESLTTKTIQTTAPRGDIYDRNGNLLAGNKQVFTVKVYAGDLENDQLNILAANVINLLKSNGDNYIDDFPIKVSSDGTFRYTYSSEIKAWLSDQGMPSSYSAEQAFNELRNNMNIPASYSKYEAQKEMQTNGVYPPISVGSSIKYTYDKDRETFLDGYGLKKNLTADEAFKKLRKYYEIDKNISDKKAREILVVRNALHALGYSKYMAADIATGVSDKTIIEISEDTGKFNNVEVVTETKRYYPNDSTASHILGYMGAISSDNVESYKAAGYSADSLIGQSGIEKTLEPYLKGEDGEQVVQVDAHGNRVNTVSETDPVSGSDVYLTIDLNLQKAAESALEKGINAARSGSSFKSKYGNVSMKAASNCKSGAVVAIDIETGDVLAMASYPDYDPNLFAEGISSDDWASVQSKNTRDSLAPAPLYNIATMSAVQPGSTFKPVTASAALASGLNPNRKLRDAGAIKIGQQSFGCMLYNEYGHTHGYENLMDALEVSCNYYFYDIGMGRDYASGSSLGYKCGADVILDYAKQYGLGQRTGIEIAESTTETPSAETKMASKKGMLANMLWTNAEVYFTSEALESEESLDKIITTIVDWTEENPPYQDVIDRLRKLPVKEGKVVKLAETIKFSYFTQAQWVDGDILNLSIGQGDNAYTPLQMCNYVATLGNGGLKHQVSVIKSVQGKVAEEKATSQVDITQSDLKCIITGMTRVCNGSQGSLRKVFGGFPVKVAGKTGTAERSGKINTKSEVSYIKSHFSAISGGRFSWSEAKNEMYRIMKKYPKEYPTQDIAIRQAVINLGDGKITGTKIDSWKGSYDNFGWVVCMAPADDPKIAVAVLLVQGGASANAGPIAREVIGQYLIGNDEESYSSIDLSSGMQH